MTMVATREEDGAVSIPDVIPGGLPLVGHLPLIAKSRFEFIDNTMSVSPVSKFSIMGKWFYFVNDFELLQRMLVSDSENYIRGVHFKKMRNIVGRGVVTTSGELHRLQRKVMIPAFSQRRLEIQMPIMRRVLATFVEGIEEGEAFDPMGPLMSVGCEISCKSMFGEECPEAILNLVKECVPVFVKNAAVHALDVTGLYQHLPTRLNRKFDMYLSELDEFVYELIDARVASSERKDDLLDTLIYSKDPESGNRLGREGIRDQVVTVLMASTETTANTVAWALYELGRHPRIADECRKEVDTVMGGAELGELEVGRGDLPGLKRVLMEVLRLYPSSYLLSREAKEDVVLGGYAIPKGSTILYSHYGQQRAEGSFSHATEFDPSRWLPENSCEVTNSAFMPFGYGAYRCLGETVALIEATYFLAMILRRFDIKPDLSKLARPAGNLTLSPLDLEVFFWKRGVQNEAE